MNYIGIDVGGTKCLGVVTDQHGNIFSEVRLATPDGNHLIDTLCAIVSELTLKDVLSIGIGLPGLVRGDGVFCVSPHIKEVDNIHVVDQMRACIGYDVLIDNDATAAALAEWKLGAARGAENALVITIGTGIGGGIISGGQMQRGSQGFAGEFGHFVVQADGRQCVCGQKGCWETYASGTALGAMWSTGDGRDVMVAHLNGDSRATKVLEEFAQWVATGLASLVNAYDPECIVIGGGLVSSSDQFLGSVTHHLREKVYGHRSRRLPEVVPAQLGEKAGAIGSALLGVLQ